MSSKKMSKKKSKLWKFVSNYHLDTYKNGIKAGDLVRIKSAIVVNDHLGRPTGNIHPVGEIWTVLTGVQDELDIIWLRQANGDRHTWDADSFFNTFEKVTG